VLRTKISTGEAVCPQIAMFATVLYALSGVILANSVPQVKDVAAAQRTDGSGIVDVWYTLEDADGDRCTVTFEVSDDAGSTWGVPATVFLSPGALGPDVTPGRWHILWNSQSDLPGAFGTTYQVRITADDGQTTVPPGMVLIPGGTFQMGDSFGEVPFDERPVHTVTLSAFYMGRHEITNGQYCEFLNSALGQGLITVSSGSTPGRVYQFGSGTSYLYCYTSGGNINSQIAYSEGTFAVRTKGGRGMADDPIVEVSWYGAVAYCNWRSLQEGREPCYDLTNGTCDFNRNGYHLPTEAQWECAARGGLSGRRFPWGDTISHSQANYVSSDAFNYDISPTRGYHPTWNDGIWPYTSPVGSFAANGYGLYDMTGNAGEWCHDWYGLGYDYRPQTNPTGPSEGAGRVYRGGFWSAPALWCRVSYRYYLTPGSCYEYLGFRVCMEQD